jgi:CBS domain-containing protein
MTQRKIGAVLVTEGARLVGIFTERDLLTRVVAKQLEPAETRLDAVMTPDPDVIQGKATVRDALELMHKGGYRHLPVRQGQRLIGIVSIRDLYSSVTQQMESDILLLAESLLHN